MIHLLSTLKNAFPFLHKRSATEDDFFEFCAFAGIDVVFTPLISIGVLVKYAEKDYIFLNDKLHGWFLRYVMFHELAHYLFHFPSQSNYAVEFFTIHSKKKNHLEAEQVAALLLLPMDELVEALKDPEFNPDDRMEELIQVRMDIGNRYGI
jgi:Zn-dependent peptidase ImmA (M78 family)